MRQFRLQPGRRHDPEDTRLPSGGVAARFMFLAVVAMAGVAAGGEFGLAVPGKTVEVNEVLWLDIEGEPSFDPAKNIGENTQVFTDWMTKLRIVGSWPDGATVTTEPDVQIKFSFAQAAFQWDLKLQFKSDKTGVHVLALSHGDTLILHRVTVGGVPDDPFDPPILPPNLKPNQVTFVFEKDETSVPRPVAAALRSLNDDSSGIVAAEFEQDTVDGDGQVPDQYKIALAAAREAGLPALVVQSGDVVVRVVRNPQTAEQVLEAIR